MTYQALSQENDNIFLPFENGELLIHSILEALKMKEKDEIEKTLEISEEIRKKIDTTFDIIEAPAIQTQLGEE